MSDLRLTFENVQVPSADCNLPPAQIDPQQDNCHVVVNTTDGEQTHPLRFDRKGDNFELSVKLQVAPGEAFNSQDRINWFVQNAESSKRILETIRVMGATLSSTGIRKPSAADRADKAVFQLVLANYIVTGRAIFPGQASAKDSHELAVILLDVLATSDEPSVQDFIGKIAYFQADPRLEEKARERAAWTVSILNLVPKYKKLMQHLVSEEKMARLDLKDSVTKEHLDSLQRFVAKVIIDLGTSRKLRYDRLTYEAYRAYEALHADSKKGKGFCEALAEAIDQLPQFRDQDRRSFIEHCRNALKLSQMPMQPAVGESLRLYLVSWEGKKAIEGEIRPEVRRSRMSPGWLAERGQIDKVSRVLAKHLRLKIDYEKGPGPHKFRKVELFLDAAALKTSIQLLIQSEKKVKHREPVLAALGVLRLLFGRRAIQDKISVFLDGEYQEIPVHYSRETVLEILRMLEEDLGASFLKSDVAWPIAQGSMGGLGVTALGLGLGLKRAPTGARQGLFIGGCSAIGFSLGSLVQLSKRARNKHIWGGVGGAVGAALFGSACAVLGTQTNLFKKGGGMVEMPPMPDPGKRNPVDEYGP